MLYLLYQVLGNIYQDYPILDARDTIDAMKEKCHRIKSKQIMKVPSWMLGALQALEKKHVGSNHIILYQVLGNIYQDYSMLDARDTIDTMKETHH